MEPTINHNIIFSQSDLAILFQKNDCQDCLKCKYPATIGGVYRRWGVDRKTTVAKRKTYPSKFRATLQNAPEYSL